MKRIISFLAVISILFTMAVPFTAGASSPYETETVLSSVASDSWMSAIRGETRLTEITIPGTHDSCARKFSQSYVTSTAKCQSLNITEQLNAGVRFLDVRCECDSGTLSVKTVHGSADCWNGDDYYYLDFVFQDVYNWLDSHPSETVLISVKEDDGDVGAATFTRAIYEYIHGYGQGKYFYGESYNYQNRWYLGKAVPTLDTVRGKCVLMNRFDQVIETSGSGVDAAESGQKVKWLDYGDSSYTDPPYVNLKNSYSDLTFHVQDYYKWHTDDKITATQYMLNLGHYRGEYYFNFSSTVSDSLVPNPENLASTVNAAYPNFTYTKTKPSGIFAMDFATESLCRYIINNNEGVSNIVTGTDGNITYTLNRKTGVLRVSGNGAMNNYAYSSSNGVNGMGSTAPWGDQLKNAVFDGQYNSDLINTIIVDEGVTSIGNYAFYGFDNVTEVSLPSTVNSIGEGAFTKCASLSEISINDTAVQSIGSYAFKDCTSLTVFNTADSVSSINGNAFTNANNVTMYGSDGIYSQSWANANGVPYVVKDFNSYSLDVKTSPCALESENPFAGKDLSKGVTISFSKYCNDDEGWNSSLINFSTGRNRDNRYFIIMSNGTLLFNDGNGGAGGNNGCYFDINSTAETNTTSPRWVDIDITVFKNNLGNHILKYYADGELKRTYNLNEICASGYPYGASGNDGIFSFLSSGDIRLFYGASFSVYGTMAGTAEAYLDKAEFTAYAKSDSEITKTSGYSYFNTFTDSLGGTPVTGHPDGGVYVHHDTSDNNGRTGTAYFPYTQNGGNETNYITTNVNPFASQSSSDGFTVSFWQRINGNYWENLESLTFAQGEIGEMKYFTLGTDGYIRFNNGNGGSDLTLSNAGLYFDYTESASEIRNKQWQFITYEIIDDYNFRLYINGEFIKNITVSGTEAYVVSGGLMSFLTSGDTKLCLGSYTPYWGTCTLSLDNVYCFNKALTDSEVYSLYLSETSPEAPELVQEFNSLPEICSGAVELAREFSGKEGALYIPRSAADGAFTAVSGGNTVNNLSEISAGSEITLSAPQAEKWVIVNDATGEIISTANGETVTFTLAENVRAYCLIKGNTSADLSAYEAAVALAETYSAEDYSAESFSDLTDTLNYYSGLENASPTQIEADNAAFDILTAISGLVPYLYFDFSGEGGSVSAEVNGDGYNEGKYSLLFGTRITLSASPDGDNAFLGWYEENTKRIFSFDTSYTFVLTSNTKYKAIFKSGDEVTLTFKNFSGQLQQSITKTVSQWNEFDSLDSLLPPVPFRLGYTDGEWSGVSEALSLLKAGEDTEIRPVYTQSEFTPPAFPETHGTKPAAELYYIYNSDESVASFIMALGVPEGCHIESAGIALYYKKAASFNPCEFTLTLNNRMTTSKFEPADENSLYTLDISKFSSKYNWAVRGYATYYDAQGNLKTVYSDQINIVDKESV